MCLKNNVLKRKKILEVLRLTNSRLKEKLWIWGSHLDSILECLFLYILMYNIS